VKPGLILLLATAALAAVAVLPGTAAAASFDAQSSNWAGYAISDAATIGGAPISGSTTALTFSSVTATWVQPRVTCKNDEATYSAFWVGIGGFAGDAGALEQTGTQANCNSSGNATYSAWYELVPAPTVNVHLKIRPRDVITASVNILPTGVLVQLKNRTLKTSYTKLLPTPSGLDATSAEWIAEAPSTCDQALTRCRALPLANFGTVPFTRIAAIANGHGGTITDSMWSSTAIDLVPDLSGARFGSLGSLGSAKPGAVDSTGRSFSVAYSGADSS
jgi:hypothetical protein